MWRRWFPGGLPRMPQGEPPVVCFAGQDWVIHGPAHCDFQIMRQLGKRQVALVVNGIGMRLPRPGRTERPLHRVARKAHVTLRYFLRRPSAASPYLYVMTPLSLPLFSSRTLRTLNARMVAAQVWVVSRALGIRDPWALTTLPTWLDVVEVLGWDDRIVYYRADDHAEQPDVDVALIRALEDRLIDHAHVVLYASERFMARERARSGDRAMFLDHGVETDHFTPPGADHVDPPDLAAVPHPRVGFFGQIDATSVDLDLIALLADELPDADLVMIGRPATDVSALVARPNVHLLGFRPYDELPQYARGFDVGIVPLPHSAWIDAANPIKLKEYLSLGLPVVATGNDEMERFREHVALCCTHDEFVDAVRAALEPTATASAGARRASVLEAGERARRFDAQLALLERLGVVVPLDDVVTEPDGAWRIAITFDDALVSFADVAVPAMEARGLPSALFVPTGVMGAAPPWSREGEPPDRILDAAAVRRLPPSVTLGSHGRTHRHLTTLAADVVADEVAGSRGDVTVLSGRPTVHFASPFGDHDDTTEAAVRAAGYVRSWTVDPVPVRATDGATHGRVSLDPTDWPVEVRLKVRGAYRWMGHYMAWRRARCAPTPRATPAARAALRGRPTH